MEGYRLITEQKVTWRDLDALGHVNNAVYATYLETARMEYLSAMSGGQAEAFSLILAEITITYKSPAFLRETLLIGTRVGLIRNSSFTMEAQIVEKETGRLVATSHAVLVHYDYTENRSKAVPPEWRELISQFEERPF